MNIVVPGDPNVMADALRSMVMVLGTSSGGTDYVYSMIKAGLMVSLLITLVQGVLMNGFRLDKLLLHFVLVMGMFLPTTSVTIESSVDSGVGFAFYAPQVVDDVPLVAALPLSVGTSVGSEVANKIDLAFRPSWEDPFFCGGGERCSKLVVFNNLLANFSARFNGLDRDVVLSRNMAEFGRFCDPSGAGPNIKEYIRKDVVAQWSNYCDGITSDQKIIWADFYGSSTPKVGPRGELLSSTGVPLAPNKTCVEACRAVGDVLNSDDVLLFSGCKPGSECYTKSKDIFDRVLYVSAQLGLENTERMKRNFVFACSIDSLTDSDQPIGPKIKDVAAQSRIGDTGCAEWASKVRAKLVDTEQKIKSASSTSMQWLVLLSGIMPLIMLASSVSMGWMAKMLPTYMFYLVFISSPNIVFSVSDAMFASQTEAVFKTAFSSSTPRDPGEQGAATDTKMQCEGDPTCHINTAQVLMQVATAAEAAADFQSKGNLALLGLLSAIGGLSAAGMALGGGGGGGGGTPASNALGAGGQAGAAAVLGGQIGGNLFGAGASGAMSLDKLGFAGQMRSMAPGLMSIAGAGNGAGVGAGKATAESSSGVGTSKGTDSSAGESFTKNLSATDQAAVSKAYESVKAQAQAGAFTSKAQMQDALTAAIMEETKKSKADASSIAGAFVASLDGKLSTGGKGLGDILSAIRDKSPARNAGNMLPGAGVGAGLTGQAKNEKTQTGTLTNGLGASRTDARTASQANGTDFANQASSTDSARLGTAMTETFQQSFAQQLQAANSARLGQTSDTSMRTGSSYSMPSSGDIAGFNALGMIKAGVGDAAGVRDYMMGQLAKGGLSAGQINNVMGAIDQQMQRNEAFGSLNGQGANMLASAGAALQNMAVKGDEASRQTAMQAGLALIGQGDAARDFAGQMGGMATQRAAIETAAAATLAKGGDLKDEVGARLNKGMQMANDAAGFVLSKNKALGDAVQSDLAKMAAGSQVMDRGAVNQVLANALNRVSGSNLNAVEASQAIALANEAFKGGTAGLVKGIATMSGLTEDQVKGAMGAAAGLGVAAQAASAGAVVGSVLKAGGDAAAKTAAALGLSGALTGGAAATYGARVATGVAMLARGLAVATPVGAIAAAIDLGVGAATGQTLTSRAVDAVVNGIAGLSGGDGGQAPAAAPAAAPVAAAQDAGNTQASAGAAASPSPVPSSGDGNFTPAASITEGSGKPGGATFKPAGGGTFEGGGTPMFGGGISTLSASDSGPQAITEAGAATGGPSMASGSPAAESAPAAITQAGSAAGEPSMASPAAASDMGPMAYSDAGQGQAGVGGLPDMGIMSNNTGGGSSGGGFGGGGGGGAQPGADAGGPVRGASALSQGGAPVGGGGSGASPVPVGGSGTPGPLV